MGLFTEISPDADNATGVTHEMLETAIQVWGWMQEKQPSIADAAMAFNTTTEIIKRAVCDAVWLYLHGPADGGPTEILIGFDGE